MLNTALRASAATATLFTLSLSAAASDYTLSEPVSYKNLSIWFVKGPSAEGPVPLTLQEALESGSVQVIETGDVNNLTIQNTGTREVFVQSGDIVKGGKQDRVLSASMILKPKSGKVPVEAFCVEQSRWSKRGGEDVSQFAASERSLPTREAKIAMKVKNPVAEAPQQRQGIFSGRQSVSDNRTQQSVGGGDNRQGKVWNNVSKIQGSLSATLDTSVAANASPSSLQLALENDELNAKITEYAATFDKAGRSNRSYVGYVVAVNGELSSADIYPSNGLHLKMLEKNLKSSATEAMANEASPPSPELPSKAAVLAFLDDSDADEAEETVIDGIRLKTRKSERAYAFSTERENGEWVHRNVLAH